MLLIIVEANCATGNYNALLSIDIVLGLTLEPHSDSELLVCLEE